MRFTIANPDKIIFQTEARLVQLPGPDGLFEVLDRHAPIIAVLKKGKVRIIDTEGNETTIEIDGGIFGMANNSGRVVML